MKAVDGTRTPCWGQQVLHPGPGRGSRRWVLRGQWRLVCKNRPGGTGGATGTAGAQRSVLLLLAWLQVCEVAPRGRPLCRVWWRRDRMRDCGPALGPHCGLWQQPPRRFSPCLHGSSVKQSPAGVAVGAGIRW